MLLERGMERSFEGSWVVEANKELVSLARFVELLNDELRRDSCYRDGMHFIDVGTGYDFVAPMLTITGNMALAKSVFDRVSIHYTIIRK